jgi:hypothetical protein
MSSCEPVLDIDLAIYGLDNHHSRSNGRPETCPRLPHLWLNRGKGSDWSKATSSMSRPASAVDGCRKYYPRSLGLRLFETRRWNCLSFRPHHRDSGLEASLLYICKKEQRIKTRPTHGTCYIGLRMLLPEDSESSNTPLTANHLSLAPSP